MIRNCIVLLVLLGVVASLFFIFPNGTDKGTYVLVEMQNEVVDILPLDTPVRKEYKSGEDTNVLLIEDGKASVAEANCHDLICARSEAISEAGETIICLPHKFVLTILSAEEKESHED